MYGVLYAIAQFKSQLDAVVIDRHLARALRGKSSPVRRVSAPVKISDSRPLSSHLTCDNPRTGPPAYGEEEDEEADESNQNLVRSDIVDSCADDCHNQLRNAHAYSVVLASIKRADHE